MSFSAIALAILLVNSISLHRTPRANPASSLNAMALDGKEEVPRIQRTEDGRSLLTIPIIAPREIDFTSYKATFDFGETKGLGGENTPVVNQDKSLIAVTNYPATKTSYVHLFIRQPNGDLTVIHSFNGRAMKLLKDRWAKAVQYRLEVRSISGHIMQLSVFDYTRGNEADEHRFAVSVSKNGNLALAQ